MAGRFAAPWALHGSFVPDRPRRALQECDPLPEQRGPERAAEVNRLQKTLEGANIKLGDVATDIMGVSRRRMLQALIAGATDAAAGSGVGPGQAPDQATRAPPRCTGRSSASTLSPGLQVAHIALDGTIAAVCAEIASATAPLADERAHLQTIPEVGLRTTQVLLAEVGTDMARFPTADHLASWAGMCPGNDERAGNGAAAPLAKAIILGARRLDRSRACRRAQ